VRKKAPTAQHGGLAEDARRSMAIELLDIAFLAPDSQPHNGEI
jgi:hypothetical protein